MIDRAMIDRTMKHNPGFLQPDQLIAGFIARKAELESLLETVRGNDRSSNQHVLVIGRRGLGKTMLVRRLALAIERDVELARRWVTIVFAEEAYQVATAGELWLEALHQLAEKLGDATMRQAHAELRRERDDERLRVLALARLLDFADARKARLLVIVENLQDLLGTQMSDDEAWVLRHTLLNEPRIMMVATATSRFDEIDQPKQAAYELFALLELHPLTRDEVRDLWARLTGERLEGMRVRPLEIFTGGSPRLLTVLGSFAKGRSLQYLMDNLLGLIDEHTDYFKSNVEALSTDERRVFVSLCELWEPSPTRAVAELARFDVNKTSMLLGRLVQRGAVEITEIVGRVQYYQSTERLYNLYHRLRRSGEGDARAQSIVDFMMRYYSAEDVGHLVHQGAREALASERRDDVVRMLRHLVDRAPNAALALPEDFWQLPEVRDRAEWQVYHDARELARLLTGVQRGRFPDIEDMLTSALADPGAITADALRTLPFPKRLLVAAATFAGAPNLSLEQLPLGLLVALAGVVLVNADVRFRDFGMRVFGYLADRLDSLEPRYHTALTDIIIVYYGTFGMNDRAIALARRQLDKGETPQRVYQLGQALCAADPGQAIAAFRRTLELDPNHARAAEGLLELLWSSDPDEARRFALAWLDEHPRARAIVFSLFVHSDHEPQLAARCFDQLDRIDWLDLRADQWAAAFVHAAKVLDLDQAREIAEAMLEFRPSAPIDEVWRLWIGEALVLSRHADLARHTATLDAQCPHVFPRQIGAAVQRGELEQAFALLERLATEHPLWLELTFNLHREALLQLALSDTPRLHALIAQHPELEPLAFALAQELGLDVRAPHEVVEIAKDIRAELQVLRNSSYAPTVEVFAASESEPTRRRKKPSRKQPKSPKKSPRA